MPSVHEVEVPLRQQRSSISTAPYRNGARFYQAEQDRVADDIVW